MGIVKLENSGKTSDAELGRSEAHLAAFFEQPVAGMSVVDTSGRFTRVNDRFCEITGRSRDELLGLRMHDITHPDDLLSTAPLFEQSVATGRSFEIEKRYIRPDASIVWVHNSVSTARDADGCPQNTVCITIDITARKAVERQRSFMVELIERLRTEDAAEGAKIAAAELLGCELGVARAGYGEIDEAGETVTVEQDWTSGAVPSLAGAARLLDAFGPEIVAELREGRTLVVEDYLTDPRSGPRYAATWESIGTRSLIVAPILRDRRLYAILYAHEPAPRRWTKAEIGIVAMVAEQTAAAVERARAERRLRESEDRFRRIADAAPVPMWVTRLDRKRSFVNRAYIAFLGTTYAEAVNFDWRMVIHPDDQAQVLAASVAGEASLKPFVLEGRYRRADGQWRWLRSESQPRWGPAGEHIGFIGVAHDITEAKQAEAALRESQARLLMAQRGARAAAWEWSLATHTIRWVDPAMIRELAGADVPEVISDEDWLKRIHPEDVNRRQQEGAAASEAGAGRVAYRIVRDGEVRWLETVGEVTARDADGRPLMMAGITLDITEQKRAEARLRESEMRLRLAIDAAHMGIWESDLRTGALRGSPQLNRLLGLAEGEPLDIEVIRKRYYPGERERLTQAGQEALRHPERFGEIEFRYCLPNGAVRWLLLRAQAQTDASGTPVSFVGVVMDTTERKRAEEHQQLLINELNHRVKNTLAIVQGLAQQTFKGTNIPAEARQAFEGRLAALSAAHNLLTRRNWEAASIRQVISDAVLAVGPKADRVEIQGPDLLLAPKTAVSLAMAVHELSTNAVKYGSLSDPEGRVEVRWRAENGRLKLVWRESGGPEVSAPQKRGFGTRMIEHGLAGELRGEVRIDFRTQGLVCTVDAPLPEVQG